MCDGRWKFKSKSRCKSFIHSFIPVVVGHLSFVIRGCRPLYRIPLSLLPHTGHLSIVNCHWSFAVGYGNSRRDSAKGIPSELWKKPVCKRRDFQFCFQVTVFVRSTFSDLRYRHRNRRTLNYD